MPWQVEVPPPSNAFGLCRVMSRRAVKNSILYPMEAAGRNRGPAPEHPFKVHGTRCMNLLFRGAGVWGILSMMGVVCWQV